MDVKKYLEQIKSASSLKESLKLVDAILEVVEDCSPEEIVDIGAFLHRNHLKLASKFYEDILGKDKKHVRDKLNNFELTKIYLSAASVISDEYSETDETNRLFNKAKLHLDCIETHEYGLDKTLLLQAYYCRARMRYCGFNQEHDKELELAKEAKHYLRRLLAHSSNPIHIYRAQMTIFDVDNLMMTSLNRRQLFEEALDCGAELEADSFKYFSEDPKGWYRLYLARMNIGITHLKQGIFDLASQKFDQAASVIPKETNNAEVESEVYYQYLVFAMLAYGLSGEQKIFEALKKIKSTKFYSDVGELACLREWALCLYECVQAGELSQDAKAYLKTAQNAIADRVLEDMQEEWECFSKHSHDFQLLSQKLQIFNGLA